MRRDLHQRRLLSRHLMRPERIEAARISEPRYALGALELNWQGERREQLRASFSIREAQPLVRELAARNAAGGWVILGQNLSPEFQVTSGVRHLSSR